MKQIKRNLPRILLFATSLVLIGICPFSSALSVETDILPGIGNALSLTEKRRQSESGPRRN
ncbi:hypothetical protein [Saccharibacillus sacchari]|uniref:hypothetical protein n=1 Tax=Saccharibacillus sacchari TaxID=456493 RepID=UPI00056AEC37|nr:hypothetical protein [Saccharibacillus sacchari]